MICGDLWWSVVVCGGLWYLDSPISVILVENMENSSQWFRESV